MRNVVGDFFQSAHQRLDALEHDVEIGGEPVELIADTGHRQSAGQVAGHDALRRVGDGIEALEHASRHEEAAGEPQHDDKQK